MAIAQHIFRGYDIRGIVPTEINEDTTFLIAKGYATFLAKRRINEVVITRDNRIHSESIKNAFVKGLTESGINVIDIGLAPVFFMYFGQYYFQSKGGVSVSASHNPKEFNGFKLAVGYSDTMITEEIQELLSIVNKGEFVKSPTKGSYREEDIFEAYKKDLFKRYPNKYNFKVVVDTGNCTPGAYMPDILRQAGCSVVEKNTSLDGNFPLGTPDPTERDYIERLGREVVEEKADIGFCYDPDGDRIGIVDGEGSPIWNDSLVAVFAKDLLDFQPGATIVYNTMCSKSVTQTIEEGGGKGIIWLTGHSFIKAKVKETRASFGGELSGHFFFMDNFYGHDDSAFSTLRLLSYLQRKKITLKEAVGSLPFYVSSPEIKLGLADDIKFKFIEEVLKPELMKIVPCTPLTIDGVRVEDETRMVIIRASQNGPYVGLKFEGKTQEIYDDLKVKLGQVLHSHPEIDWSKGANIHAFE